MDYSRLRLPWKQLERGQGFFVPCLDFEKTREYVLVKAVGLRIFDAQAITRLLVDYGELCRRSKVAPRKVILTFAPVGKPKTLAFIKWLGMHVPQATEERIFGAPSPVAESIAVLAELLTGLAPGAPGFLERTPRNKFAADLQQLRQAAPPDAPPSLVECICQCLAYDPEARLASDDVVAWLRDLLAELPECSLQDLPLPSQLQRQRAAAAAAAAAGSAGGSSAGGGGAGEAAAGEAAEAGAEAAAEGSGAAEECGKGR